MSCMPDMTSTLLVAAVAHLRAKSLEMASVFLKEKIYYIILCYTL